MYIPKMRSRLGAEALGTFWLVFIGVGAAIFNGKFLMQALSDSSPVQLGIGHLGVAVAFGLVVMTMAYSIGHASGAHFNPAVTIGLAVAKRFDWKDVPAYLGAQVVGGLAAGAALAGLVHSKGLGTIGNLAANGFGAKSPGGFGMGAVFVLEALVTAFFVYVFLGATADDTPSGFAPVAIGFAYLVAHLIAIPFSNAGLNPARSTAVAFFNGAGAPGQLWLFWLAPLVGGLIAGATYAWITGDDRRHLDVEGTTTDARNAELDEHGRPLLND